MLRKVLRQIDIIKSSRSGIPNFEAHEVEANDLQASVVQYLQFRGTGKVLRLLLLLDLNNDSNFPICLTVRLLCDFIGEASTITTPLIWKKFVAFAISNK